MFISLFFLVKSRFDTPVLLSRPRALPSREIQTFSPIVLTKNRIAE